ncbi:N-acetylglucosamine-binding protein GbpA [Exilibacterium tricleocarpae]|uniref:N-acetylglucosamine-binding protein GbpA n=1 Tax=Exilibacterium tricleocarpae TaxID=2591008 RepID=A0A545U8B4_9GAMM|nr:N-acetylglucosamine-binding protein GbpA [Exilibacterium tricleocarpae]TQV85706.1 N-acetylglucosamine-binding protein GbpA [Exilibacterium tricleocarpae]
MKSFITIISAGTVFAMSLSMSIDVEAHGYISEPKSRSLLCKERVNANCGSIQWEPQSVEGDDRFPGSGPADGTIAAGGLAQFSPLNEQTATRWHKTPFKAGSNVFKWRFTARHVTRDWRYFITKSNWNANQPLTRSSFELSPFCEKSGNNRQPPAEVSHSCNVPSRSGHHIILGVWDVGDTNKSFYQVVDVVFDGQNPNPTPTWRDIGDINPTVDLAPGDSASTRVFDLRGEIPSLSTELVIGSAADGARNTWPRLLAEKNNRLHTELRAGVLSGGVIRPAAGKNDVFTQDSALQRVEISIERSGTPSLSLDVDGVNNRYTVANNAVTIEFAVTTNQRASVQVDLLSSGNQSVASTTADVDGYRNLSLRVNNAQAGAYTLVIKGESANDDFAQKSFSLQLISESSGPQDYDYVFPDNLRQYRAGTKVLAKDDNIYQCKPFPYAGWCTIYSPGANAYEPGVGAHWRDAWIRVSP